MACFAVHVNKLLLLLKWAVNWRNLESDKAALQWCHYSTTGVVELPPFIKIKNKPSWAKHQAPFSQRNQDIELQLGALLINKFKTTEPVGPMEPPTLEYAKQGPYIRRIAYYLEDSSSDDTECEVSAGFLNVLNFTLRIYRQTQSTTKTRRNTWVDTR